LGKPPLPAAWHAALFGRSTVTDLGALGGGWSYAASINNTGQVVGFATIAGGARHATLFSNGTVTDLNSSISAELGWTLTEAFAINDAGQIVGNGVINGEQHAFLLAPIPFEVTIEIMPGCGPNSINPKSKGKIEVSILSNFDASSQIDVRSLTFGQTGDEQSLASCEHKLKHIWQDKLRDLVCHFYTQEAGFQCGDTKGILKGKTLNGMLIEGSDSVKIYPCKWAK